jgi:hypothetical protein
VVAKYDEYGEEIQRTYNDNDERSIFPDTKTNNAVHQTQA